MTMHRIEVNVETGEQRETKLTAKEIKDLKASYEANAKLLTWDDVRAKRDQLIRESDWTMIPGATVDQAAWASYRQTLRDLPQTYKTSSPDAVVWPKTPSTAGPNSTQVE
jgi:hypothetical protein